MVSTVEERGPIDPPPLCLRVTFYAYHDGWLLRILLLLVSLKRFLAHRYILLVPFEAYLCRIINGTIFVGNFNCFNDLTYQ